MQGSKWTRRRTVTINPTSAFRHPYSAAIWGPTGDKLPKKFNNRTPSREKSEILKARFQQLSISLREGGWYHKCFGQVCSQERSHLAATNEDDRFRSNVKGGYLAEGRITLAPGPLPAPVALAQDGRPRTLASVRPGNRRSTRQGLALLSGETRRPPVGR